MSAAWVVGVVTLGKVTRTSTLGHLGLADVVTEPPGSPYGAASVRVRTLCGAELAAAAEPPESFIRCQRCIDARGRLPRDS